MMDEQVTLCNERADRSFFVCIADLINCRQSGVFCLVKFHYNSLFVLYIYILPVSQQPLVGQELLIVEALQSHSDTKFGRTPLDE